MTVSSLAVKDASGTSRSVKASNNSDVFTPHHIVDLAGTAWTYAAAASGIANTTTAVTFKAAHATLRNYVTWVDLWSEALTTASEVAIRDGAAGTVLWRTKIATGGLLGGRYIRFDPPLQGTAATLLEVLTLTASGAGAVYFNAGGFVAE
jgi:hypothetical protein